MRRGAAAAAAGAARAGAAGLLLVLLVLGAGLAEVGPAQPPGAEPRWWSPEGAQGPSFRAWAGWGDHQSSLTLTL